MQSNEAESSEDLPDVKQLYRWATTQAMKKSREDKELERREKEARYRQEQREPEAETPSVDIFGILKHHKKDTKDLYAFVKEQEKKQPEFIKNMNKLVRVPNKSAEELKKMTVQERLEHIEDLKRNREFHRAKGIGRGIASGLSFGISKNFPGLDYEPTDMATTPGEMIGSTPWMLLLTNLYATPLGSLAMKSPIANRALEAFARLTAVGLAGGTEHTIAHTLQEGEVPSLSDAAKHGAGWVALDIAFGALGKTAQLASKLYKASRGGKIPQKEILDTVLEALYKDGINLEGNPETVVNAVEKTLDSITADTTKLSKLLPKRQERLSRSKRKQEKIRQQQEARSAKEPPVTTTEMPQEKVPPNVKPLDMEPSQPPAPHEKKRIAKAETRTTQQEPDTVATAPSERPSTQKQTRGKEPSEELQPSQPSDVKPLDIEKPKTTPPHSQTKAKEAPKKEGTSPTPQQQTISLRHKKEPASRGKPQAKEVLPPSRRTVQHQSLDLPFEISRPESMKPPKKEKGKQKESQQSVNVKRLDMKRSPSAKELNTAIANEKRSLQQSLKGKTEPEKVKLRRASQQRIRDIYRKHHKELTRSNVKPLDMAKPSVKSKPAIALSRAKPVVTKKLPPAKETTHRNAPESTITEIASPPVSWYQRIKQKLFKKPSKLSDEVWELKHKYFTEKNVKLWKSHEKWSRGVKEKGFSKQELSDMMFYVENPTALGKAKDSPGTGNPFTSKEDTYAALEKRLSPEAKKFVEDTVKPHFKEWLEVINNSPYTRKINPREIVEQIYIPHFYAKGTADKAEKAMAIFNKRFSKSNPLANERTWMTYNDALIEAGMVPKYDNLSDLMREYDRVMTRVITNSELAGELANVQRESGNKFILRSGDNGYGDAKRAGWVSFDDPYLRRYVAGSSKEGPVWATTESPALVHPDAADALTGIFVRDASKGSPNSFLVGYEAASNFLKQAHVGLSGFHFMSLSEESAKVSGPNILATLKRGEELLKDPYVMETFLRAGGHIHSHPEVAHEASSYTQGLLNGYRTSSGVIKHAADAVVAVKNTLQRPSEYLFGKFQPRLKVAAFYDMRQKVLDRLVKEGKNLSAKELQSLDREIAKLSNDMFGGQIFDLMRNPTNMKFLDLANPSTLRNWRRVGGYVDWSVSALKEAGKTVKGFSELFPGQKGTEIGRVYRGNFLRYARNLFISQEMLSLLFTGMEKKDGKLSWDYHKAHFTFQNEDPKQFLAFQLPDVEFEIGGMKFNFGRDSKGRRLYAHGGKKLLEVLHYGTKPVQTLFSKSNPVFQASVMQLFGHAPGSDFYAQQGYKRGQRAPWEGKEGLDQWWPRLKEIAQTIQPFSVQAIAKDFPNAIWPWLFTGFGSVPVSKGSSLYDSEKYFKKYLRAPQEHKDDIALLRRVLEDQGYKSSQIQSMMTRIKNEIKKEQKGTK